jgi:hypothetical protein
MCTCVSREVVRTNELPEDDTSCVEICRSSLFVIYTIIVTDFYVHSSVEFKILKCIFDFQLEFQFENECSYLRRVVANLKLLVSNTTCLQGTPRGRNLNSKTIFLTCL